MDFQDYVTKAVDEAPPLTEGQTERLRALLTPAERAAESRAKQGLPPKVEDPSVLAAVAGLFHQAMTKPQAPKDRVSKPIEVEL